MRRHVDQIRIARRIECPPLSGEVDGEASMPASVESPHQVEPEPQSSMAEGAVIGDRVEPVDDSVASHSESEQGAAVESPEKLVPAQIWPQRSRNRPKYLEDYSG